MVDVKGNRAINSFIELRLFKSEYTSIVWCKHTILRTSTIEKLTWLFNSTLIKRLTNLKRCCPVAALHLLIFVELAHHAVGVDNLVGGQLLDREFKDLMVGPCHADNRLGPLGDNHGAGPGRVLLGQAGDMSRHHAYILSVQPVHLCNNKQT